MTGFSELVAAVLDVPAADVTDETGPGTHEGWSSIKHLQLIVAVEDNYRLSFSRAEIRSLRTVGDLRKNLVTRGILP